MVRDKAAYDTLKPMGNSRWQEQIRESIRDGDELIRLTGSDPETGSRPENAYKAFPVRVPGAYLARIERNNPDDPLLRQVLPVAEEDVEYPGYSRDPVGEINQHKGSGLIQKYPGRALLITTSVCAIHCRYCFRRHYPYTDNRAGRDNWRGALEIVRTDPEIREIILSGGDPLSLTDDKLQFLIGELDHIPHLKWLRIHTRMPVVVPDRITPSLIRVISGSRMKQTVVIHANHPNEIDTAVGSALASLHRSGIQLLNQSVLLKGVNDDALVLVELSERLYSNHVLPYYLHMLDPVAGAAHFEVPESTAVAIMDALRSRLPGYLVPRLVREMEGEAYKTPVGC